MTWFVLKAALSGLIIATIAEIGRRNAAAAALVASLPLGFHHRDDLDLARNARCRADCNPCAGDVLVCASVAADVSCDADADPVGNRLLDLFFAGSALTVVLYLGMIWACARLGIEL